MALRSLLSVSRALQVLASASLCAALSSTVGCSSDELPGDPGGRLVVIAEPMDEALATEHLRTSLVEGASVAADADPASRLARTTPADGELRVALVRDALCEECYRIEGEGQRFSVRAGGKLGLQYGLTHLLELTGARYFHPYEGLAPQRLTVDTSTGEIGRTFEPEMRLRGLHLHTLHPIESYYAFWEPSAEHLEQAKRVIDWTIKNRGNYVQWLALDTVDPENNDAFTTTWREHTRAIIDYAHARGVKVGMGLQLFGTSSLQHSYLLLPKAGLPDAQERISLQLEGLIGGLGLDTLSLSFGEFSSTSPDEFIASVNMTREALDQISPGTEMVATVHVGNSPKTRVSYQGEELLYYFLVKYCDQRISPWIHSVMYYDLYEDAGGAYEHDLFDEHRQFLVDYIKQGRSVGYHPESAYWVAFDNAVPQYHPLYVRSRWVDLDGVRKDVAGSGHKLEEHVLFSSGWEWGYWQTDYATLRMNYALPSRWQAPIEQMFSPLGEPGVKLAEASIALADAQHEGLIERRLAAYIAGRDFLIDLGVKSGIVSQPVRPSFADVVAMSAEDRATFTEGVVTPLSQLEAKTAEIFTSASALRSVGDKFIDEMLDGMEIDMLRARFTHTAWKLASSGSVDQAALDELDALIDAASVITERRLGSMHWPEAQKLVEDGVNQTLYQYGYLRDANSLCSWRRERAQLRNALLGEKNVEPGCVL